jgi:hypothetical protein
VHTISPESKKEIATYYKETENCVVIYSGVNRYTIGQLGIMIWFHKAISNKT